MNKNYDLCTRVVCIFCLSLLSFNALAGGYKGTQGEFTGSPYTVHWGDNKQVFSFSFDESGQLTIIMSGNGDGIEGNLDLPAVHLTNFFSLNLVAHINSVYSSSAALHGLLWQDFFLVVVVAAVINNQHAVGSVSAENLQSFFNDFLPDFSLTFSDKEYGTNKATTLNYTLISQTDRRQKVLIQFSPAGVNFLRVEITLYNGATIQFTGVYYIPRTKEEKWRLSLLDFHKKHMPPKDPEDKGGPPPGACGGGDDGGGGWNPFSCCCPCLFSATTGEKQRLLGSGTTGQRCAYTFQYELKIEAPAVAFLSRQVVDQLEDSAMSCSGGLKSMGLNDFTQGSRGFQQSVW